MPRGRRRRSVRLLSGDDRTGPIERLGVRFAIEDEFLSTAYSLQQNAIFLDCPTLPIAVKR